MIAAFNKEGNLPPGIHLATWKEFSERFGTNVYRTRLLQGLKCALDNLKSSGCAKAYLDESFVTSKRKPGDFDACWESDGVDIHKLDPVLQDFLYGRKAQKEKYGGEFFNAAAKTPCGHFLDYFQQDKETLNPKGIILFDLEEFP